MTYKAFIDSIFTEKWQYFPKQELLVIAIGKQSALTASGLIASDGSLCPDFKKEMTDTLKDQGLLKNHVGPFGDDDFFSGIDDDNGQLQYFFEIHRVNQNQAEQFNALYPVLFIMPSE